MMRVIGVIRKGDYMVEIYLNWAIYDHPKDYPHNFVVRRWKLGDDGEPIPDQECHLADSLEEARKHIPIGLHRIPQQPGDDTVIIETWI